MLTYLIWIEFVVGMLFLWGACLRANSHFRTPWLRFAFSIPAFVALSLSVAAVAYRAEVDRYVVAARPLRHFFDVIIVSREHLAFATAIVLPIAAFALLIFGLGGRTESDGRRLPHARRWPWSMLLGGPLLLGGAAWSETAWMERSLHQQLSDLREESDREFADFQDRRPAIAHESNAAVPYRLAWDILKKEPDPDADRTIHGRMMETDWHGIDVRPLTDGEERAAALITSAGRMLECRFRERPSDSEEATVDGAIYERVFDVMTRRAASAADDVAFRDSVIAVRRFLNHRDREPALRGLAQMVSDEFRFLFLVGEIAEHAPERFSEFTPANLTDDDFAAGVAPLADDVRLIQAEQAAAMSHFLDADFKLEESDLFRFVTPVPLPEFGSPTKWYVREAVRFDRLAKVSLALRAHRSRVETLRSFVAATNALGRPDWDRWNASFSRAEETTAIERSDEELLRILMSRAMERYQAVAARRLALAAIAVAQAGRKHRRSPTSWDDVVPEFLPTKPIDPMTGEVIRWENEADAVLLCVHEGSSGENQSLAVLRSSPTWNVRNVSAIRIRRGKTSVLP